eukprot:1161324-Pelagomonas_calceolata.AAC.4
MQFTAVVTDWCRECSHCLCVYFRPCNSLLWSLLGPGHTEAVSLLLKRKANPAATNKRGQSVLDLCKPEVSEREKPGLSALDLKLLHVVEQEKG